MCVALGIQTTQYTRYVPLLDYKGITYSHFLGSEPFILFQLAVTVGVIRNRCDHLIHFIQCIHLAIERGNLQQSKITNTFVFTFTSAIYFYELFDIVDI